MMASCAGGSPRIAQVKNSLRIGSNHLAGFRLTHELLPYLLKEGGRVIMTSSESHKNMKVRWSDVMMRKHYNPLLAYKQSKLCNIRYE